MTKNAINIEIPKEIKGFGKLAPFKGAWKTIEALKNMSKTPAPIHAKTKDHQKLCKNIQTCLDKLDLKDGMTISFHHHFRGGDETVAPIIAELAKRGLKDLTLASSSLTSAHECIVPYLEKGIVTRIWTSGARGKLGKAISEGKLAHPAIFHSHGGRARAIETGKLKIDVAFIAASAADQEGNATGSFGASACGALGYAKMDAEYARQVVVLTDNLVDFPCLPQSISQHNVDYVVPVKRIGDPQKIAGDTTRITTNPMDLKIAELAAKAIDATGTIKENFSMQTGAGGASLAVAKYIKEIMQTREIKGSFVLGGITSTMVDLINQGFFRAAFDVQSFDAAVTGSLYSNPKHVEISATQYANPFNAGCMVNKLDVVILAALEIDTNFNVNVLVGSDGYIRGASGGHSDTSAGANLTVVVAPSIRGRIPIIKEKIACVVTPGSTVDLLVTERGICVNPARPDLIKKLKHSGLPIKNIQDLCQEVENICGKPKLPVFDDKIVALIEYRDGTILDVIKKIK